MNIESTRTSSETDTASKKSIFSSDRFLYRLGVIIGRHSVNLCLIKKSFNKTNIIDISVHPLDIAQDIGIEEIIDKTSDVVAEYLSKNNLRDIPVNIALQGENIAFRRVQMPNMPKSELVQAVLFESEKLFPFKFSDSRVNLDIIKSIDKNKSKNIEVNVTAAKASLINLVYDKFTKANIRIGQANFLPIFTTTVFDRFEKERQKHFLHLHLDDNICFAAFIQNIKLDFFQEFMSWPFYDADNNTGIVNIEAIITELQSFIDLYIAHSRTAEIDTIFITGTQAESQDLLDHISSETGIQSKFLFEDNAVITEINNNTENDIHKFLPAIMTAHAHPNKKPLAPENIYLRNQQLGFRIRLAAIAAVFLLLIAGMHFIEWSKEKRQLNEMASLTEQISAIENSDGYKTYLNLVGKLNKGKVHLKNIANKQASHLHTILKTLSYNLPNSINFNEIMLHSHNNRYSLQLTGNVRVKDYSPEIVLAGYMQQLEELPFFSKVDVVTHSKEVKNNRFDLSFQLSMDTRI